MMDITGEAVQQLKEFRGRKGPDSYVRIGILSGSTSGASLGVTIDDKSDKDEVFSFDDLNVIIDKALLAYCETIEVEYVLQQGGGCGGGGFKITPKNAL
jgi:Fe-S cluster assembly iron-binding protein IscA